jgi:hypothetical protein
MDGCLRSARLCAAPIAEIREGTRPLRLRRGPRFGQRRARRSNSPFERGRPGDDLTSAQPPPDLKRVAERRIPKNPSQKEESWCPDHHHPEKESLKRAHDTRPSAADMSHEKIYKSEMYKLGNKKRDRPPTRCGAEPALVCANSLFFHNLLS